MRIVAALGALLFAYLAIIPAGLVASTLDPACAGGDCETPFAEDALFVVLYGACCLAIVGCAVTLAAYALRRSAKRERQIRRALILAVAAAGLTMLALLALTEPLAALVIVAIGALSYGLIRRNVRRSRVDAGSNGHGPAGLLGRG